MKSGNTQKLDKWTEDLRGLVKKPLFRTIAGEAGEMGVLAYLVGGAVRDALLGRPLKDVDVVVVSPVSLVKHNSGVGDSLPPPAEVGIGISLASRVQQRLGRDKSKLSFFKNFGTAQLRTGLYDVEFVGARKESYRISSRKPIVENGTLEEDLSRRDFTINTLAVCLQPEGTGEIVDIFDGLGDLRNGIIRTPLDPEKTFSDDPLRMLRAARFACQLGFAIEKRCMEAMRANKHRISIVSQERITDEIGKIIMAPVPSQGFLLLNEAGLVDVILPHLSALKGVDEVNGIAHKDNFYHTLQVLDNVAARSQDVRLRWAALFHDIAKPETKQFDPRSGWTFHGHEYLGAKMIPRIFREMRLPLDNSMQYIQKLVLLHLRPISLVDELVTDSAVRRLLFDAGDTIDDLMTLCEADITTKNPEKVRKYLNNFRIVRRKLTEVEEKDRFRNWQPPVTGVHIMETFGLKPCRVVGEIKTAVREAILDGTVKNDFNSAYDFILQKGQEMALTVKRDMRIDKTG